MKKGELLLSHAYKPTGYYQEIGSFDDEALVDVFHNIGKDHIYISGKTALNLRFFNVVQFNEDNEQNKKEV